jgi:hypothetical protein
VILCLYFLKVFIKQKSFIGLTYTVIWLFHYILGNCLVLISFDEIFIQLKFETISPYYLFSLFYGLYFSVIYSYLLLKTKFGIFKNSKYFRDSDFSFLLFFNVIAVLFFLLFISKIGFNYYFSPELALFRHVLGEYSFTGIGYFYYLAILIVPAVLLMGAYMLDYPTKKSKIVFLFFFISLIILLVPLGGRGNVINIILLLIIVVWLKNGMFELSKLFTFKNILFILFLISLSVFWGNIRGSSVAGIDSSSVIADDNAGLKGIERSLGIDVGRIYIQSYIFYNFPITGVYFGKSYIPSILGPFYSSEIFGEADLIGLLSKQWNNDTVGVSNNSAMSPSFIGEFYLNFGIIGLVIAPFFLIGLLLLLKVFLNTEIFLTKAIFIFYFQLLFFHGGLYSLFDTVWVLFPIFSYSFYSSRLRV